MKVKRPDLSFLKKLFLVDLIKGMMLTFSYQRPSKNYTEQYPKARPKIAERFRGARSYDYVHPRWNFSYPGNWRTRRDARLVLKRFEEFRGMTVKKGQ